MRWLRQVEGVDDVGAAAPVQEQQLLAAVETKATAIFMACALIYLDEILRVVDHREARRNLFQIRILC